MTRIERLKLLASAIAGDFKSLRLKLGNTDELITDDKTSAVKAINEVAGSSKEIKDAMKQFSENLGFDKEITKVNNISINLFEMLIPFIKDKLAEENITNVDAKKNTKNCFFVFFDDTIKFYHSINFSKNKYGIKLKQNAYDKFVKFNVSTNNTINVNLPQEINTSQDIELDIYGILGHYMSDYKIMPYTKYIKQLNIPSDRVIIVNSLEEHEGRSYSTGDNDILVLVKINLDELSNMTNSVEKLFKLQDGQNITNKSYGFINQDATKYFDFTTREWLPLKDLISSDMQYNIMLSILPNPVDANEIKYINEALFTHTSGLNKINIAAENSAVLNTILTKPLYKDNFNIILNPELTKYYNNVTKQWNELPNNFKNQFDYLKNVDDNINIATSENNIDVANKTTQTELETDSHSRMISVVDKNKITNLSELDTCSMLSTSYDTTLVVDKTLNYVLDKNTRTWVEINSEQSQKIKDKVTIDFSLTINDTTDAEKIKCRTRVNTFSKSGNKNILVYDKNNTDLADIASVNYNIYDGDIIVDKTYTYYLNPYTSVWYELPNEVKTKLNNFVNTQYTKIVTRLKEKTNSLNIINLNEDLTDVQSESVYLVSNKENIKFRANNDYAYNFNNTLIFTEDLSEYLDIPTQEWKQVMNNYTPSIVYSVCENIVAVITNKVLNTLDYRNPVTLTSNNLTEIKNQIRDKEVIINKTDKNLINDSTIDLSKVKFYSMGKSEQGYSDSAINMLQKYSNIKIFNAGSFAIQINNKLAELLNKNNAIAILTKKTVSASHDFEIAYKGKRYQLSQDNFFINNIENLCQFISDDDWL